MTATTETSATTVYCEKVEVPIYIAVEYKQGCLASRTAHEVVNGLAPDGEANALVRHQTLSLSRTNGTAEVGLSTLAELALATF